MKIPEKVLKSIFEEWYDILLPILKTEYFYKLIKYLDKLYDTKVIYPEKKNVFRIFKEVKPKDLKIIIVGQSPYSDGKATGIAFANSNVASAEDFGISPSLIKILSCIETNLYDGFYTGEDITLKKWTSQGVMPINSSFTVEKGKPTSHQNMWKPFTVGLIACLNSYGLRNSKSFIYMLWGEHAKYFYPKISTKNNSILTCSHPAAACYNNTEWRCDNFSQANIILQSSGRSKINW